MISKLVLLSTLFSSVTFAGTASFEGIYVGRDSRNTLCTVNVIKLRTYGVYTGKREHRYEFTVSNHSTVNNVSEDISYFSSKSLRFSFEEAVLGLETVVTSTTRSTEGASDFFEVRASKSSAQPLGRVSVRTLLNGQKLALTCGSLQRISSVAF